MTPEWDGTSWGVSLPLTAWACWRSPERPVEVRARFAAARADAPPDAAAVAQAARLLEQHGVLAGRIAVALRRYYLLRRPDFSGYAQTHPQLFAELSAQLPADPGEAELDALHRLDQVLIHDDGVGLVFWAGWDPDRGVGLWLRGMNVTAVGAADTASRADEDAR